MVVKSLVALVALPFFVVLQILWLVVLVLPLGAPLMFLIDSGQSSQALRPMTMWTELLG